MTPSYDALREARTALDTPLFAGLPGDKRSINRRAQNERWASRLSADRKLLVRARPVFKPQFGFSLEIDAIDSDYTLGDLEARKREIRERLQQEGLFELNRQLPQPWDYNHVLVVAPEGGAGLGDFEAEASRLEAHGISKLLRRAIRNLLENARRYSTGEITVVVQRAGGMAEVRVCDRGPGVPLAQRERIFEPFYRLPGASERAGGVGLGLALVRSIAGRHNGTVHCEDRPDGASGACFVLRLPLPQ